MIRILLCKVKINQNLALALNFIFMYYIGVSGFLLRIDNNAGYEGYKFIQWLPHYIIFLPVSAFPEINIIYVILSLTPFLLLLLLRRNTNWL